MSKFVLDLNTIMAFVNQANKPSLTEREILDNYDFSYDENEKVISKTVRELTSQGDSQIANIRYDLVKTLIMDALVIDPQSSTVAMNTLLNEGMMKEIREK